MMSHLQSDLYEEPPEMFGAEGVGKRVLIPADPLANAKVWLAAMEISLRRTAQQAAQEPADHSLIPVILIYLVYLDA